MLPDRSIKSNIWSCLYFISTLQERKTKRGANNSLDKTKERILSFTTAKNITERHGGPIKTSGPPPAKRRKCICGSCNPLPCTTELRERLGFAVKTVLRGWYSFAKRASFSTVDDMLHPYLKSLQKPYCFHFWKPGLMFFPLPTVGTSSIFRKAWRGKSTKTLKTVMQWRTMHSESAWNFR